MFISVCVVVLYLLPGAVGFGFASALITVPIWIVVLCLATFAAGFLSYLWAPRRWLLFSSLAVYLLLALTLGMLTYHTGGSTSPFIGLWVVLTVFSGIFGFWGIIPIGFILALYLGNLFLAASHISPTEVILFFCLGVMPLAASFILWHPSKKSAGASGESTDDEPFDHSTDKADAVIRAIDNGVISINSRGNIDLINPAAQNILGWKTDDAAGLSYRSILKLEDNKNTPLSDANDPVRQAIATGKDVHSENYTILTESGKRRLLSLTASPQAKGAAIVVIRDVTESKKEEREQAEFISTASHEMRTPVASIEGYLGLVLGSKTINLDPKAREYINKAHDGAQHLGRLLQDLLDISKAEDGRLQNTPHPVEVVDYIGDIVEGFRPKAVTKGLVFTYKPRPQSAHDGGERVVSPALYANVDKDHLHEVAANLIENAIKYTPDGEVVIDVTGNNSDIRVSVTDSGIGIPPEDIGHLFQKFYRVDNSETREIGGTGLGLYLSRRLTEMMGGRIWVESRFQKGSTFHIEIPRITHEEADRLFEQEKMAKAAVASSSSSVRPVSSPPPAPIPAPSTPTIAPPMPPPAPIAVTQQQQQQQQPAPAAPPQPQPTLAAIEQNPAAFTASNRNMGVQIPNREQTPPQR